jgi:hypothetical protein
VHLGTRQPVQGETKLRSTSSAGTVGCYSGLVKVWQMPVVGTGDIAGAVVGVLAVLGSSMIAAVVAVVIEVVGSN